MSQHVQERESDRRGLLYACKTPERPLAVVLVNSVPIRYSHIGYQVHALVLAVIGARPACEAEG